MDFLANVKQKIQEMEEQARLLQHMEQGGAAGPSSAQGKQLFQPKNQQTRQPNPKARPPAPKGRGGNTAKPTGSRSMRGSENFSTPRCATGDPTPAAATPSAVVPSGGLSGNLLRDLHGRLDEAFLLTEVLGPPRCVRGWEED